MVEANLNCPQSMNRIAFKKSEGGFKPWKIISTCGWSLLFLLGPTALVMGNPSGGAVVAGSATIGSAGLTLTINQSSHNAIINWQQFSIAGDQTTKFVVPNSSSATLNRVVGGNPSAIYGTLQSNGIVYLVNPSGIVVGPSGRIDTSSFLASTLDISNQQFLAGGNLSFAGSSDASIDNEGVINASIGSVYLIANQVKNGGTLSAAQGNVGLAAGSDILFQQAGNQHLFVVATPAGTTRAIGVTNAGTIRAAAAELRAAGGNAYALAINNSGAIAATGYKKINGQVYLTAEGGSISNSGQISAHTAGSKGGTIVVNGSGVSSSGTVLNSGLLNASATAAGAQGGSITIKNSGGTTVNTASGQILATGGAGGKGGTIETSGASLQIDGTVSAGKGGSWLLDPSDVTIDNGSGVAPDVNVTTLENGLNAGTSETVQTVGGSTDNGNIDLNVPLTWTSSATLQLTATGNINLNDALSGVEGKLSLSAGGTIADTASLSVSSFVLQNGYWNQNSATLPAFSASNDFQVQNSSTFLRVTGGNGTSSPFQITDIYGLEGLGSPSNSLMTANAELMNNIDASETTTWHSGAGFVPIGSYDGNSDAVNTYSGTFNGQGFTINGLYINTPSAEYAGLFGDTANGAVVENVNLTNVTVIGNEYAGGLDGVGNGTFSNVSSSGTVSGSSIVGGLMGILFGSLTEGSSAGTVTVGVEGSDAGGLVGYFQSGTISNSYSAANVTAGASSSTIGGLVGVNLGTVSNSYSSGVVAAGSGSSDVGGLVGSNDGAIQGSFWDTTTSGITSSTGGVGGGTNAGVTGATSTQLMSQTYIQGVAPSWNFTTVWTTNGGTTLPQLLGGSGGGGPVGTLDTLSGTAFTNSGVTDASDVTIDLLYNGTLLGSTTTNGSGGFTFSISSNDLTGGILLTDPTDKGDTFYQANSPAGTIGGIDLWGSTLRVMADSASNAALKQVIGSLTGNGINYAVSGANLTTTSGVSMNILSNYTLGGNITASGTLDTSTNAVLGGTSAVVLTGSSVTLSGAFDLSGALTVDSTSGEIFLDGVGTSNSPATFAGVTLNATGPVLLEDCNLSLASGNFAATGNGYVSTTNANGEANGINLFDSSIAAAGGNITLTGHAGYDNPGEGIEGGLGVGIGTDGSTVVTLSTTGSGNITINGTFNQNITSQSYISAVDIYQDASASDINNLSVVNGKITINGTVSEGETTGAGIGGVFIGAGSLLQATGAGSIALTGNASAATALASGSGSAYIAGVEVSGKLSVTDGGITLNGTSGTVNTSNSTLEGGGDNSSMGVLIDNGGQLTTGANSTITLTGTAGTIVTTGAFTGSSDGVSLNGGTQLTMGSGGTLDITGSGGKVNAGNGANAGDASADGVDIGGGGDQSIITVATGGSIAINGTGGILTTTHAEPVTGDDLPSAAGVSLDSGAEVEAAGTTTIALTGHGGTVTAGSSLDGNALGVNIGAGGNSSNDDSDFRDTVVSSDSGQIEITGVGGSTPNLGIGVVVHGFNGAATSVESTTGNIIISGTGGSGYAGTGVISGNYIPNHGIAIVDNADITTRGNISLTGKGGANSDGLIVEELTDDTVLDADPVLPVITAGNLTATTLSGTGMSLDAVFTAANTTLNASGALALLSPGDPSSITTGNLTLTAAGALDLDGAITATGLVSILDTGANITLGTDGSITDSGESSSDNVILAAGNSPGSSHAIINNSSAGANAIQMNGGNFYLYSKNLTGDTFGGITVPDSNLIYSAHYSTSGLPSANEELFYAASASGGGSGGGTGSGGTTGGGGSSGGTTSSSPSTTTGGADDSGSNIVPPALTPQPTADLASPTGNQNLGNTPPPPHFNFQGSGIAAQIGQQEGGLANSSSNSGLVGSDDAAQLGNGQLNNVANPQAAGTLNMALGPVVYHNLSDALIAIGDWANVPPGPGTDNSAGGGETILSGGDVVEIGNQGVKNIPLSQAPQQLKNAMSGDVLNGVPGTGH